MRVFNRWAFEHKSTRGQDLRALLPQDSVEASQLYQLMTTTLSKAFHWAKADARNVHENGMLILQLFTAERAIQDINF